MCHAVSKRIYSSDSQNKRVHEAADWWPRPSIKAGIVYHVLISRRERCCTDMRHHWDNCRGNICTYTTRSTRFVCMMDGETFGFCIRKVRLEICASVILNFCLFSFFLFPSRMKEGCRRQETRQNPKGRSWHPMASFLAEESTQRCSVGWEGGSFGEMTLCFNFSLFFIAFCSVNLLERNTISQFWWWFAIIPAITTVTSEWQVPVLYRVSFPPPSYC